MSSAIKSQGTVFKISTNDADSTAYGSASFVTVSETAQISEPSGEASDIDVTHLSSTSKEYLIGLPDLGNFNISGNFVSDDTGQLELIDARDTQNRRWIQITFSDATVWYVKALVKKYSVSAQVDGRVPFSASFRTSGSGTFV